MKSYRFKAYDISWEGPEGSWHRFVQWGYENLRNFWAGIGVVIFDATPDELRKAAKEFKVSPDSFTAKVGPHYEPIVDLELEDLDL